MYDYGARLTRIIDADTWVVDIDLGLRIWMHDIHVRADGIDAPELHTPAGHAARNWTAVWFAEHCPDREFTLNTVLDRPDKYGRILGTIVAPDGFVLNDDLITYGHAEPY